MIDKIREGSIKRWKNNKQKGLPCGKGATVEMTKVLRPFIEESIVKYKIKSISDAGCGDYAWMALVNKHGASYVGYDINDEMLNQLEYKDVSFEIFDITQAVLPKTDLIICKDCLIHLTTEDGVKAINNFRESGSKYLMSTTYDFIKKNVQISKMDHPKQYGFRKVNLQIAPYNLGTRLCKVYEPAYDKYFSMWKLN